MHRAAAVVGPRHVPCIWLVNQGAYIWLACQRRAKGRRIEESARGVIDANNPLDKTFEAVGDNCWGQCHLRPDHFLARPCTLGNKHWPTEFRLDSNFPSIHGLDWPIEDSAHVMVTGLLVRGLGLLRCGFDT